MMLVRRAIESLLEISVGDVDERLVQSHLSSRNAWTQERHDRFDRWAAGLAAMELVHDDCVAGGSLE